MAPKKKPRQLVALKSLPSSSSSQPKPLLSYPYKVDYNDHFETPLIAYEDILPMLDAVAPTTSSTNEGGYQEEKKGIVPQPKNQKRRRRRNHLEFSPLSTTETVTNEVMDDEKVDSTTIKRSDHIIYDPYYCNGRTKMLLQSLGFENVQHEKRDFYKDIQNNTLPSFHTIVTNPPYSHDHKEKCMTFAIQQLRGKSNIGIENNKAFFILMPNYVACRNHFRSVIRDQNHTIDDPLDIMYVIPSIPYDYEHPEGTGKDIPPFHSIWYCGIPLDKVDKVKESFRQKHGNDSVGPSSLGSSSPRLVSTLQELQALNAVPTMKRPNPKQRKRARKAKSNQNNVPSFCNVAQSNKSMQRNQSKCTLSCNQKDTKTNASKKRRRY